MSQPESNKHNAIAVPSGDLPILLQHRALLFGILGGFIMLSAFRRHLRPAAVIMAFISMVGFIVILLASGEYGAELRKVALIDAVAIVVLIVPTVAVFRKPAVA